MDADDDDKRKALDDADDQQIGRFCDAFVSDFDGTSALIIRALEKDRESPTVLVETLTEILRQAETSLPGETCERFESELIPHVTQIVLAKSETASIDMESVECIADFLESVLERVAHRLLYCDPCLLPTLVRILDDQRAFYENRLDNATDERMPFVNTHDSHMSPLYLRILSHWGAVDGFTILLRCLQASGPRPETTTDDDEEQQTAEESESHDDSSGEIVFPFDAIQCIYRSIYAIKDHLSLELLKQYVGPLAQSSRIYVTSMNESEFASVPRDKLLELVHIVEIVVAQASSNYRDMQDDSVLAIEDAEVCVQLLQLDLMFRFFTASSLEKRIYGLVEMIDVVDKAQARHVDVYCKWIHENQLVDLLFGEKKHPELIKRALTLLRFVVANHDAPGDWIDAMWVCFAGKKILATPGSVDVTTTQSTGSHTHEIVRVTVHALLLEVIGFAPLELLEQLMVLIQETLRPLDADVLALLSSMAKRYSSLRAPALMYLWTKLSSSSSVVATQAIEEVVSVIGLDLDDVENNPECLVDIFIRLCVESIESTASNISVALRLIEKIAILVKERLVRIDPSTASKLVPVTLAEMEAYEQQFKQASDAIDYSPTEADNHVHGVRERLLALRGCMVIATVSLHPVCTLDVVHSVWDMCVHKANHSDESASLFFQWIEYCFRTKIATETEDGSRRLVDERLAQQLIHQRFASLEGEVMTMSALGCFHHLFRKVNIAHGGIVVHNGDGEEVNEDNDTDDTDSSPVFSDLLTGKQVVGVEELWRFALHAADQAVAEEAMTLLARYHMDVVPPLVESEFAYERKRAFIAKCTRHLCDTESDDEVTHSIATAVGNDDTRTDLLVGRCLDCLRYFLDANQGSATSSDGGSPQIKDASQSRALTSDDVDGLNRFALENLEEKLQLVDIYPSPMKEPSYAFGASSDAGAPVMQYSAPRRPSWNFKQHHALLEAIQDECDHDIPQSSGINDAGDQSMTTPSHGDVYLEIPTTERRLSIDTSVPGMLRPTQLTTSPSVRARPNLQWYQGLHVLSSQEPDFVIQGLEAESTIITKPDILPFELPLPVAQLLVNWPKLFDTLFDLVHRDDSATSQRAWGLLCQLPINAEILKRMLKLRPASNEDVPWSQLLDGTRPHRLLYSLRLVEALLLPCQQKEPANYSHSEDTVRRQWRERFLRLGGTQHIQHLLSILQARNEGTPIALSCMGALARLLTYMARLHESPPNVIDLKSSFDSRLCHATLPKAFPLCGEQIESLFELVVKLLGPKSVRLDARSEATALCIIELFCCLVPLNPTLTTVTHSNSVSDGVYSMLETAFSTFESKHARAKLIHLIVGIEHRFSSEVASRDFYETVLKTAFEMMSGEGDRPEELLELIVALSHHLSTIAVWMAENSIVSVILAKVQSIHSSGASLGCYLRLVAAMASQTGPLHDACLQFRPVACEELELPWILDLLVRHILWNTAEKTDTASSLTAYDPATRQAAQEIVLALVFRSGAQPSPYTTIVLRQLSSYYQTVQSRLTAMGRPWNLHPADELQEHGFEGVDFAGLVNPGCVCYMNSLMQQLFMMPAFRRGLLMLEISSSSSVNEWQHEIAELQKLFVSLASSDRKALDPTEFALSHRDMDGNPTDLNLQMDADEFFCLLLDRVETCVLNSSAAAAATKPTSTFLDQCFGGVLVNQILTEHGHLSEREEKFFALSLDISQKQHLPESLSLYVQGETLDGDNAYYCEQAKKKVSATKRVCIKSLPQTLVCHLKRFEFDFDTMQKIKIHDYLAFPEEIDMFPYTSEAFASKQSDDSNASSLMYDLAGIVVHSGSSDMGHYYSFIKDRAAPTSSNDASSWFEFNDQTVKPFDVSTMGDECFGGEEVTQKWDLGSRAYVPVVQCKRRSAYMLVYERRDPAVKLTGSKSPTGIDWTMTPASVQEQRQIVLRENQELRLVVNAVTSEHLCVLQNIADATLVSARENQPEESDRHSDDWEGTTGRTETADIDRAICQLDDADIHTAVISCQHVFGVSSLLQTDDDSIIGTLLEKTNDWLKAEPNVSLDRKLLFCKWLLGHAMLASGTGRSDRVFVRRTWMLDVLLICDKRLAFVQNCCSLLQQTLQFLVTHGQTFQDKQVAMEFLRYIGELFYERHDVVIEDPASGTGFPVSQASIIHAVMLFGAFLKDCVTSDEDGSLKDLLLTKSGFVDRFLFSFQDDESSRRLGASIMAPLTSRERSCTFSLERQLLTDAFTALPRLRENILKDPRLLMNHSVLKNIVVFEFTEVLTPLMEYTVRHQMTRTQGEKFVSLLLAVLEEVKSTHLDQLLHVFGALLDTEYQADTSSGLASIHEHIFSPSSGLLEAAAYYRDHRTLHEYAFLLVEFVVTRADASPRLQRYFQNDQDIASQVEWVKHWLGNYLDPHGTIRRSSEKENRDGEDLFKTNDPQEDPSLEKEVRLIFGKAERAFGFAMLQTHTFVDDEDAQVEDKAFAVESLEDSDGLLFSSDGENQDDDDDDTTAVLEQLTIVKTETTAKHVLPLDRRPSPDTTSSRLGPKSDRSRPEVDDETSSSSTIATRVHMSSAA